MICSVSRSGAGQRNCGSRSLSSASLAMFTIFGWLSPFSIGPAIVIAVIWYFGFYKGRHDQHDLRRRRSRQPIPAPGPKPAVSRSSFNMPGRHRRSRMPQRHGNGGSRNILSPSCRCRSRCGYPARDRPGPPPAGRSQPPPSSIDKPVAAVIRSTCPLNTPPSWLKPDPVGLYVEPPASAPIKLSNTALGQSAFVWFSLIVLGLTLSGLGIAQALGVAIPLAGYLAAALLVIGATLVAATWLGMARGLLPLGDRACDRRLLIITAAGPALRAPVRGCF